MRVILFSMLAFVAADVAVTDDPSLLQLTKMGKAKVDADVDCAQGPNNCKTPPTEPPTQPPPVLGYPGICGLTGDPHIMVFDREEQDRHIFNWGDYWIVKSDIVWIQGRYMGNEPGADDHFDGKSWVKQVAISEPKIGGNKIVMISPSKEDAGKFTFNDKTIKEFDDVVDAEGTLGNGNEWAKYEWKSYPGKSWQKVGGRWKEVSATTRELEITLADVQVTLFVEKRSFNVNILHPQIMKDGVSQISGHCGDFDGEGGPGERPDPDDQPSDSDKVGEQELLFKPRKWNPRIERPSGVDCTETKWSSKEAAVELCKQIGFADKDGDCKTQDCKNCVIDSCNGDVAEAVGNRDADRVIKEKNTFWQTWRGNHKQTEDWRKQKNGWNWR